MFSLHRLGHLTCCGLVLLVALSAYSTTHAGDEKNKLLVLHYSSAVTEPPHFEEVGQQILYKAVADGKATGDLEAAITVRVTQVVPNPEPDEEPFTILVTLITDKGTIEGLVTGTLYQKKGSPFQLKGNGKVYSVTAAYTDLFLADISLDSVLTLQNGQATGDTGVLTITANP